MDTTSCVVTGAARGIGRGIAELMVARGHRVVVTDVDAEGAERTAREIGAAAGLGQDVRDASSHTEVAAEAASHGDLVAWFSNAGVGDDGALVDLTDDQVRRLVEVNLLGAVWSTRAALAAFGPRGGDLVLTASLSGLGPVPGLSLYAATKAAVVSLATSVSMEAPRGVRVHALLPDGVDTALVAQMRPDGNAKRLVTSGGRMLTVEETAQAAVDLVGSRRVLRTLPGWRGAAMRAGQLAPSLSRPAIAAFALQGRRRLR
ncbi:SDR family NAD(P)-dependent oxidoreductase [Nocardioides abyssi]|uniref:SDR family oxidoreductase n=1 Tax=Nocardioides abyssi TaxID=3058370 RepID=A0ABT8EPB5_9ACTN|nr:SDR family oxidoreductase [Nocardioides abyssi]MDN4159969.1 SDR family oxidoreductase [Nocardioides abyssi]